MGRRRTAASPTTPRADLTGGAFAVLYIPRLGLDYQRVVLEGTSEEQLTQGPGHYEGTAMPGEPGNMGLAGHRVGKGSPFLDLDQLRPGDPIVVETVDSWFVYRVLGDVATGDLEADPSGIPGQEIVRPTDVEVLVADPERARGRRAHRLLPDADHLPSAVLRPAAADHPRPPGRRGDRARRPSPTGPRRADRTLTREDRHVRLDLAPSARAAPRAGRSSPRSSCSAVCALLLFVVFPWVEPRLPFNDVTVGG